MNEKSYKKRLDFQQKTISRQSKQIEDLISINRKLQLEIEEKNNVINSVEHLRKELTQNVNKIKKYRVEYENLIDEIKEMKKAVDQNVYKGRWRLIRLLMK